MLVHNAGRLMEDEVGMQGLAGLLDMIDDPERKGARVASNFVASWLPYSSALRQIAGFQDPYLRRPRLSLMVCAMPFLVRLLVARVFISNAMLLPGIRYLIRQQDQSSAPAAQFLILWRWK